MKDCSNCKDSPLNNSKLSGRVFEKTPCYLCVMEDQIKRKEDRNFIESCGNVEFNEMSHGHISPVTDFVSDALMRRMVKMKLEMWDLVSSGQLDAIDCRIVEMMLAYLKPSLRVVARRLNISHETVRERVGKVKRLLSM